MNLMNVKQMNVKQNWKDWHVENAKYKYVPLSFYACFASLTLMALYI